VLLDGKPMKSCTRFAVCGRGREVMTVEGLEKDGKPRSIQEGFYQAHRTAVRLLHARHADDRICAAEEERVAERGDILCISAGKSSARVLRMIHVSS